VSVVAVGLEHRAAPLEVLERACVDDDVVAKVLNVLAGRDNVAEAVLLSTCLRTEIYAVVDRFHDAVEDLQGLLADRVGVPASELAEQCTVRFDDDVPAHLFSVAAGLESVVIGESEILGQVRRAAEIAAEERTSGPVLSTLFGHAVRTGRRVRSETGVARGTTSFAHGAVELVESRRGGITGADAVVLGAGEIGSGVVTALCGLDTGRAPARVSVVNRTPASAEALIARVTDRRRDGRPPELRVLPWEARGAALRRADVAWSALGPGAGLIDRDVLGSRSPGRSLVLLDVGMPRTVDPSAGGLDGVDLLTLDDVSAVTERALQGRREEVARARGIVAAEVERYRGAARARGAAPVIAALRERVETLRIAEIDRSRARSAMPDDAWAAVDATTRAVVAKLLHQPSIVLKDTAGTARGERLVEALRVLFDL